MSVALAGRAPATFEIKSANLPLVALLLKSPDLALLSEELKARFGDMPDFFDHDPLVIDISLLKTAAGRADTAQAAIDFVALQALLRPYKLNPIAVRGGSDALMQAAQAAGLVRADDASVHAPRNAQPDSAAPASPPPPPAQAQPALVVDKPLRSGQQVYARGRDLVVMAMVNAGAEVVADGHIHVYAPLRGKAIAGARGNGDARIFTLAMEAELVSIAGIYRTSETPWPDSVRGKPAQLRLAGGADSGKLVLDPIKT
jgi:septum site-determining protein MinC